MTTLKYWQFGIRTKSLSNYITPYREVYTFVQFLSCNCLYFKYFSYTIVCCTHNIYNLLSMTSTYTWYINIGDQRIDFPDLQSGKDYVDTNYLSRSLLSFRQDSLSPVSYNLTNHVTTDTGSGSIDSQSGDYWLVITKQIDIHFTKWVSFIFFLFWGDGRTSSDFIFYLLDWMDGRTYGRTTEQPSPLPGGLNLYVL